MPSTYINHPHGTIKGPKARDNANRVLSLVEMLDSKGSVPRGITRDEILNTDENLRYSRQLDKRTRADRYGKWSRSGTGGTLSWLLRYRFVQCDNSAFTLTDRGVRALASLRRIDGYWPGTTS